MALMNVGAKKLFTPHSEHDRATNVDTHKRRCRNPGNDVK